MMRAVLICTAMAAINLPFVLAGNGINAVSMAVCLALAGWNLWIWITES